METKEIQEAKVTKKNQKGKLKKNQKGRKKRDTRSKGN